MITYNHPLIGTADIAGVSRSIASIDVNDVVDDLNANLVDRKLSEIDKASVTRNLADVQTLALDLSKIALAQDADRDEQIKKVSLEIKRRECQVITLLQHDYRVSVKSLPSLKLLKVASLISVLFASINHANASECTLSL